MTTLPTLPFRPSVNLEDAIRPFTRNEPMPTRGVYMVAGDHRTTGEVTTTEGEEVPALVITARCKVESVTLESMAYVLVIEEDEDNLEIERTEEITRITNPEDSSQYVDVADVVAISFRNQQKLVRQLRFNNFAGNNL